MDRSPPFATTLADNASRYGTVSRALHWGMALCFAVVFAAALAHYFAADTALEKALWPLHKPTGALLLLLVMLRSVWALRQRRQRPLSTSRAAHAGHLALYALMWAVPVIAMIRQYGSGNAFAPFGVPLVAARPGDKIEWMTQLGGLLHGELGWALMFLVAGHIGMALLHRHRARTGREIDVLPRMLGRPPVAPAMAARSAPVSAPAAR